MRLSGFSARGVVGGSVTSECLGGEVEKQAGGWGGENGDSEGEAGTFNGHSIVE